MEVHFFNCGAVIEASDFPGDDPRARSVSVSR